MLVALVLLMALLVSSAPAPREQVGPLPGGGFLLNSGWRVQAVGKQVPVTYNRCVARVVARQVPVQVCTMVPVAVPQCLTCP